MDQLPLLPPIERVERVTGETLDERFDRWIAANPKVLDVFVRTARDLQARGWRRGGAKMIAERLRWIYAVQTSGDEYALNNSYVSRLARLAIETDPALDGFFALRALTSRSEAA